MGELRFSKCSSTVFYCDKHSEITSVYYLKSIVNGQNALFKLLGL